MELNKRREKAAVTYIPLATLAAPLLAIHVGYGLRAAAIPGLATLAAPAGKTGY